MWRTSEHWRQWITQGRFPDHPWRSFLQRAALTLKGLTYAPTGALLAASTTSLPETPQGERNWDYRYAWVRDSTFALWGLYTIGFDQEANDFFYFIADACKGADGQQHPLQVLYGVGGEREIDESTLDLSGYEGASRCGSATRRTTSSRTTCGAPSWTRSTCTRARASSCPRSSGRCCASRSQQAIDHWREPDRGIWEVRGEPQHFVSSKLFCWVALDRGARLAWLHDEPEIAEKWEAHRRGDQGRHPGQRPGRARGVHPVLRHRRRWTPR